MEEINRAVSTHQNSLLLFSGGRRSRCQLSPLVVALLVAAGCGGPAHEYDATVTGTVTIDGELAKSGTVTFHPVKEGHPAIGRIHPDGSYSLRTGQGDLRKTDGGTLGAGEYLITVSVSAPTAGAVGGEGGPPIAGPSLIARKYALKETTDLRYTVKPGENLIVLELAPAEAEPPAESPAEAVPAAASGEAPASTEADKPATSPAEPAGEPKADGVRSEPEGQTPPPNGANLLKQPSERPVP